MAERNILLELLKKGICDLAEIYWFTSDTDETNHTSFDSHLESSYLGNWYFLNNVDLCRSSVGALCHVMTIYCAVVFLLGLSNNMQHDCKETMRCQVSGVGRNNKAWNIVGYLWQP